MNSAFKELKIEHYKSLAKGLSDDLHDVRFSRIIEEKGNELNYIEFTVNESHIIVPENQADRQYIKEKIQEEEGGE